MYFSRLPVRKLNLSLQLAGKIRAVYRNSLKHQIRQWSVINYFEWKERGGFIPDVNLASNRLPESFLHALVAFVPRAWGLRGPGVYCGGANGVRGRAQAPPPTPRPPSSINNVVFFHGPSSRSLHGHVAFLSCSVNQWFYFGTVELLSFWEETSGLWQANAEMAGDVIQQEQRNS
ncbi:hypothetical protein J6590_053183 [Homalodisca vitripennis]|nr:hypothetical protein J6590_053183 [Homalodisca vitripennis]